MYIEQLLGNTTLIVVVISWALSCIIKGIIEMIRYREIRWTRFTGSGGMPSSHSATVTSLCMCIGFSKGFDSVEFTICCVLAFVVMYDASGVRRAAGKHASSINMIIEALGEKSPIKKEEKLKELLGHKPIEVLVGAMLGIIIAVVANIIVPM